jgi:hypothetical protein
MARGLKKGEEVFVPRALIGANVNAMSAYYRTEIYECEGDGVYLVSDPSGREHSIHARHLLRGQAVALILIEDGKSTTTLLDPLHDSIFQYLKLLLPDEAIRSIRADSVSALALKWDAVKEGVSIVVIIGHGHITGSGIVFALDGLVKAQDFLGCFGVPLDSVYFLSMACYSGQEDFGKPFSGSSGFLVGR